MDSGAKQQQLNSNEQKETINYFSNARDVLQSVWFRRDSATLNQINRFLWES
jgi:hypothetical protein